jgi:hypothetical protein
VEAGGGPERDDYGLPPVDVEIPDDARELDPDVQAYRRELRALRRQERANRLRRPLRREGMALPLLAACLMLALITSTLLVLFAADETGMPQLSRPGATRHPPLPTRTPATGQLGQPLPAAVIIIDGKAEAVQTLTGEKPSLLALVPGDCSCVPALRQLASSAGAAHVPLYLIGTPAAMPQLTQLAAAASQSPQVVGDDKADILPKAYGESGLTAVVVKAGGSVAFVGHSLQLPEPVALEPLEAELRLVSQVPFGH